MGLAVKRDTNLAVRRKKKKIPKIQTLAIKNSNRNNILKPESESIKVSGQDFLCLVSVYNPYDSTFVRPRMVLRP